ncbi:hypothetical protein ACLQ2R_12750 [Streptosporangium sp. DT93]|uniref:hypothetical protein n=1 Tax=Streptosporangium sp. DT93 TaxID=3393428 RepID=UPI003CEA1ABD
MIDKDCVEPILANPSFDRYAAKKAFRIVLSLIMIVLWLAWALFTVLRQERSPPGMARQAGSDLGREA